MSATGRSDVRVANDFYETPAWCVRRYLESRSWPVEPQRWLEPSAGGGAVIRAVNAFYAERQWKPVLWTAVEKFPLADLPVPLLTADFLSPEVTTANPFDLCIGNPPYSLAQEFIEKGLTVARSVAFLLRLNFLESEDRYELFKKYECNVKVLPNRPSFRPDGGTDATAYAWFEFGDCVHEDGGRIEVLGLTSKEERKADRIAA